MGNDLKANSVLSRPIQPFGNVGRKVPKLETGDGTNFRDIFASKIQEVNQMQQEADARIEDFVTGKTENLSDVLTTVEKADLAFRTLMQIRNKLVDAFQEINRIRF